jgi:hypothetical protein
VSSPWSSSAIRRPRLSCSQCFLYIFISKPSRSPIHFTVTTSEPYAICCIEGLKVSMGMHNFGEKRWGSGLIDDIRSQSNPNTRIVGDFTKSITVGHIVQTMKRKISTDASWKSHLNKLPEISSAAVGELADKIMSIDSVTFRRQLVQTRFFELGNNCTSQSVLMVRLEV